MNDPARESRPAGSADSDAVARRLLHELQVHQAELTQQNEDLRLARGELEASLARRQALFEFAPIALLSLDGDGKVTELNRRATELLGTDAEPGVWLFALVKHDSRAVLAEVLAGSRECAEIGCRTHADDGRVRTAEVRVFRPRPQLDEWLVALVESTERHRAEAARLGQAGAEAANRQKSAFLARMSHELRTPLNAVLGFTHLLSSDPGVRASPTAAGWVARTQESGLHLLRLVDDLLDLARLENASLQTQCDAFDAVALLEEVASMLGPLALLRPVKMRVLCRGTAAWVTADRQRTRQVLINLVGNAIKYNRAGGEVRLDVAERPGEVSLVVDDDGPGMTPQQQAGLFRPFERLGAEQGAVFGVGLGLTISRELVQAMHGRLEVSSTVGRGSTFTVSLPAAPERADGPDAAEPLAAGTGVPVSVRYVEDNEVNVELMRALMQERPHVQLRVARDGRTGLALVHEQRPDAVLLDMHLPDMDGLEFFARLRADPATSRVPCVAVSANAMSDAVRAAIEAGIEGYLTKPLDVDAFFAVVDGIRPLGAFGPTGPLPLP